MTINTTITLNPLPIELKI